MPPPKKSQPLQSHPVPSESSAEWPEHEHVVPALQNEAQRLVARSGSPELAKQAIDAVSQAPGPTASRKDAFAREHGFASYLELFEASTPVKTDEGRWCVTALSDGKWLLWNERELPACTLHASFEAARDALPAN